MRVIPISWPVCLMPQLNGPESRKLPSGFKVHADARCVAPMYAGGSHRYIIVFTDPEDISGLGGADAGGGGSR